MRDPEIPGVARLVEVRLHTRREGDLQWQDRGRAFIPEIAASDRGRTLRYDAGTYRVEDVFDDGSTVTVWARATPDQRRPSARRPPPSART